MSETALSAGSQLSGFPGQLADIAVGCFFFFFFFSFFKFFVVFVVIDTMFSAMATK